MRKVFGALLALVLSVGTLAGISPAKAGALTVDTGLGAGCTQGDYVNDPHGRARWQSCWITGWYQTLHITEDLYNGGVKHLVADSYPLGSSVKQASGVLNIWSEDVLQFRFRGGELTICRNYRSDMGQQYYYTADATVYYPTYNWATTHSRWSAYRTQVDVNGGSFKIMDEVTAIHPRFGQGSMSWHPGYVIKLSGVRDCPAGQLTGDTAHMGGVQVDF